MRRSFYALIPLVAFAIYLGFWIHDLLVLLTPGAWRDRGAL